MAIKTDFINGLDDGEIAGVNFNLPSNNYFSDMFKQGEHEAQDTDRRHAEALQAIRDTKTIDTSTLDIEELTIYLIKLSEVIREVAEEIEMRTKFDPRNANF